MNIHSPPEVLLLVEDDPKDLELTLFALERCGLPHEIVLARDGEEALHYLLREGGYVDRAAGNPSLILLDLKLPKVDGVEVLKQIRFNPGLSDIPVIVLSASNMEADLHRTHRLGIERYIVKPLEHREFVRTICAVLGSRG